MMFLVSEASADSKLSLLFFAQPLGKLNLRQPDNISEWHQEFAGAAFDAAVFAPVKECSQEKVHPAFAPIALFRLAGSHNVRRIVEVNSLS
jgi:hypothetical protein